MYIYVCKNNTRDICIVAHIRIYFKLFGLSMHLFVGQVMVRSSRLAQVIIHYSNCGIGSVLLSWCGCLQPLTIASLFTISTLLIRFFSLSPCLSVTYIIDEIEINDAMLAMGNPTTKDMEALWPLRGCRHACNRLKELKNSFWRTEEFSAKKKKSLQSL